MQGLPYADIKINKFYELLFGDNVGLALGSSTVPHIYPWGQIFERNPNKQSLLNILEDEELGSRAKLLATTALKNIGVKVIDQHLYGVIVEVALDEGLDTLAAYEDFSARYINHTGKMMIWDLPTPESNSLISNLLSAGWNIVQRIGPWENERLPAPPVGNARISFLVSDGLYFGEAPFGVLRQDPMGGAVLNAATALMRFLIDKSLSGSS